MDSSLIQWLSFVLFPDQENTMACTAMEKSYRCCSRAFTLVVHNCAWFFVRGFKQIVLNKFCLANSNYLHQCFGLWTWDSNLRPSVVAIMIATTLSSLFENDRSYVRLYPCGRFSSALLETISWATSRQIQTALCNQPQDSCHRSLKSRCK